MRFCLFSTLQRPKTPKKAETFENGDVKSVTCHRFQSKSDNLSKMAGGLVMLKHEQSHAQSFLSVLVWIGENDTKTLVWMKIVCFVFAKMKTDTFKNAFVWMGPKKCKRKCIHPSIGESLFTLFVSLTYAYHYLMTVIK